MSTDIEELQRQILLVAKTVSGTICGVSYNMFLLHLRGEEYTGYVERWKKELETVMRKIDEASTVEKALQTALVFDSELVDYVAATKVDTADKAMEIAHSFIKKYSPVALPLKAVKEDNVWLVDIDVGALAVKVAKVKVDARTGDILSYEIPERK